MSAFTLGSQLMPFAAAARWSGGRFMFWFSQLSASPIWSG